MSGSLALLVGYQIKDIAFPKAPAASDSISGNDSLLGQSINGFHVDLEECRYL